jgi:WD40 repeat protein/predicted Ser/Thr protein kinase
MAEPAGDATERRPDLDDVVAAYLTAVDAGERPDRQAVLDSHPELQDELEAFFAAQDELDALAAPLRNAAEPIASAVGGRACFASSPLDNTLADAGAHDTDGHAGEGVRIDDTVDWPRPADSTVHSLGGAGPANIPARFRDFGDYELLQELARGGMGVVFKAHQRSLNRIVALKMILSGWFASDDDVRRFRAEAEAAAALEHPHIVPIYEVGQHGGLHYFTMKLVDGGSLAARIREQRFEPKDAARLVAVVARAVHHAHQRGILHRDLKPSNILLDARGEPHVTDFGLAKLLDVDNAFTQSGAIIGTPGYMAPEQSTATNTPPTTAIDVFSLGTILYELLTGRPPFHGDSVLETLRRVRERDPDRPSGVNPRIDRDLETIVLCCLEKDPAKRYGSAEAMADDLDRWLAGEPVRARPVGDWERAVKWARRRPTITALAGLLAVVLLTGSALLWIQWRRTLAAYGRERVASAAATRASERAERLAEADRDKLYAARVRLAQQAWLAGDVRQSSDLLASLRPADGQRDRRGFEWFYLWRLCHSERLLLDRGSSPMRAVAISPDGKIIATAGNDPVIRLWDAQTGHLARELSGHTDWVGALAFSPDGETLASGGKDRTIRLWNWTDGRARRTLTGLAQAVGALAFSPDGRTLVSGGAELAAGIGNPYERFSPDARNGELKLWDVDRGTERDSIEKTSAAITAVRFSPDGATVASASADGVVTLWGEDRQPVRLEGHVAPAFGLAFAPDGRRLATVGYDGTTRLWDVGTGRGIVFNQGNGSPLFSVAFSPDGQTLAVGGYERAITLWDIDTGHPRFTIRGHSDVIWSLAFAPDGRSLASASWDGSVRVWEAREPQDGLPLRTEEERSGFIVAFSPDGGTLAVGRLDAPVSLWGVVDRERRRTFEGSSDPDICLAFSPDGTLLAAAGGSGLIRLWKTTDGTKAAEWTAHDGKKVCSVAFAPDGRTLASGGADRTLRLWDVASTKQIAKSGGHTSWVRSVAFSPDGKTLATGSFDHTIKVWNVATHATVGTLTAHASAVNAIAFSPDGQLLASASEDKTVRLWDVSSLREHSVLRGHTDLVFHAAWSPDGRTLGTASWDGTIKLWHVATGQELVSLRGNGQGWSVALSPDGRTLAGSFGGNVYLWPAAAR